MRKPETRIHALPHSILCVDEPAICPTETGPSAGSEIRDSDARPERTFRSRRWRHTIN
ncbi:hypothetical protein AvCA_37030 [Azotobacter vinelandii CA]|uniref:Uncharacterized protein n=2 Tax=Azotobacter vinelandii TaxID=354 RepID=C1DRX4_AZOVD|nr:hypothetical protein Avin_37030 [Azotobacter vinelandii DJ]AGK14551.1 hypothetical protein AvCA_37030 [Azotobacter vinelandii CA]AGK21549.1 hypothetical protein AvCA6_37030 [Azotobacter vinelandii CA6]